MASSCGSMAQLRFDGLPSLQLVFSRLPLLQIILGSHDLLCAAQVLESRDLPGASADGLDRCGKGIEIHLVGAFQSFDALAEFIHRSSFSIQRSFD